MGDLTKDPGDGRIPATDRPSFRYRAYRRTTQLLQPFATVILRLRERRGKEDPARRLERLGVPTLKRHDSPVIWVHAASVGEVNSAVPLIKAIGKQRPDLSFLLTTGTASSARSVASQLPDRTSHQFLPLDAPRFIGRFLDYWKPCIGVFVEQEIWPNLVTETHRRGIAMAIVNGRMSERSYVRWRKRADMARFLFSKFDLVLAQNEIFASRLKSLGATSVRDIGNIKIDAPPPPVDDEKRRSLVGALRDRERFLAASTHDGEERLIGEAHRTLAKAFPRICTIIAPRHPERGTAIEQQLVHDGFKVSRRSRGELPAPETQIYLADTLGELGTLYATCDVAFIGGSIVPRGGQNPIESVRHDSVVLVGPHRFNFEDFYGALFAQDAALAVSNAADIAQVVGQLLTDRSRHREINNNAQTALRGLTGGLDRAVLALLPLLPRTQPPKARIENWAADDAR